MHRGCRSAFGTPEEVAFASLNTVHLCIVTCLLADGLLLLTQISFLLMFWVSRWHCSNLECQANFILGKDLLNMEMSDANAKPMITDLGFLNISVSFKSRASLLPNLNKSTKKASVWPLICIRSGLLLSKVEFYILHSESTPIYGSFKRMERLLISFSSPIQWTFTSLGIEK